MDWAPAPSPLKTRWADHVSPDNARPEYPRPQAVRKDWENLNGIWEFAFDDGNTGLAEGWASGHTLPDRILVPWTFEASLSGIGRATEVHERVWYRRTFDVPEAWRGKRTILHFGAVDWEATVWVNGKKAGAHRGGYAPFKFDITDHLTEGPQELVVMVYDPAYPKKGAFQPRGKQLGSKGIWYTRTTGIWQTVWLEPVNELHILDFDLDSELDGNLRVCARIADDVPGSLTISVSGHGQSVTETVPSQCCARGTVRIQDPILWAPETPALYDVTLTLRRNGRIVDEVQTYCAFRTVGMSEGRITLNGEPYFLRGVLDQGYWPDGIYTAPTDEAMESEVRMTKDLGFNLGRKHIKAEDPRWYYHCDRLGLLVAQDMPSSHNLKSAAAKENFLAEWGEVIQTLRNHPSIILWIPFNENWGDPGEFQDQVVDFTRTRNSSRPIIDASGWTQRQKTDIIDVHDYGNDLWKHCIPDSRMPRWVGECGGVALRVQDHTWVTGWGYQCVKTPMELMGKYKTLIGMINNGAGLSGFVYTQLTDVEQEVNGVMTYDRIPKAPPELFAAANGAVTDSEVLT